MKSNHYVVATIKPWNIEAFHQHCPKGKANWHLIDTPEKLNIQWLREIKPRYIFFPHWSWIVPTEILSEFTCVCFHMTDLPYGRGGSPLQNLIVRGHKSTQLTALKMTDELDAGPIFLKQELSLAGSAQAIFENMAQLSWKMITTIVTSEPTPQPQVGDVTLFSRRKPEQSELAPDLPIDELYDHIRMLDAESYPRAYMNLGDKTLTFSDAHLDSDGKLQATVTISSRNTSNNN